MPRPPRGWQHATAQAVGLTLLTAGGMILAAWLTERVTPFLGFCVLLLLVFAGLVTTNVPLRPPRNRGRAMHGWTALLVALSFFSSMAATFQGAETFGRLVLRSEGHSVTAVVTHYHPPGWHCCPPSYDLQHLDGSAISGRLTPPEADGQLPIGHQLVVVESTDGRANPRLPSDLDPTTSAIILGALLGLFAIMYATSLVRSERYRRRQQHPASELASQA